MPAISLVICQYQQGDLLQRLLREAEGCYDDLVVVHDGPDTTGVGAIVAAAGGQFFARPREYQQEPHWPFAWGVARHEWILRLDADELPSPAMKAWLRDFRQAPAPPAELSGYTCYWPMWNGRRAVSRHWPAGRNFFFHKNRVSFFGMAEQVPKPDARFESLELVLNHEPSGRESHSLRNLLWRRTAWQWRYRIAHSLLGRPTDLACWRWTDPEWPMGWEQIRQHPWWTAAKRLVISTGRTLRDQWRADGRFYPVAAFSGPLNSALICVQFWRLRRRSGKNLR